MLVVSLATVVCILTVGFVAGAAAVRHRFEQGVSTCVATLSLRKPQRDALENFRRGKRDFYSELASEWGIEGRVPGVVLRRDFANRAINCHTAVAGPDTPLPEFGRYMQKGNGGNPYRIDPIYSERTLCGKASHEYIEAYNAEMVRLSPESVARYCR